MSILEKCNPQKFLIAVFVCVFRGELFFYLRGHAGEHRFFVFRRVPKWLKLFTTQVTNTKK
jgi:hypothetical protein